MAFRRARTEIVSPYTDTAADRQRSALELKALSQSIREIRKQRGMTQAELGIAIGTEQAAIARLESGRHAPSFRTLQAIARATGAELDLFYRPLDPTVMEKRPTMTDSRPGFSTNRRNFLGGAMGLAGVVGSIHRVTAQEATAAATAVSKYQWVAPDWEDETKPFEILGRTDDVVTVTTVDGQFDVPADPQRLVILESLYVPLIQLGITNRYVGVATNLNTGAFFGFKDQAEAVRDGLGKAEKIDEYYAPDIEQLINLNPDLMIGYQWDEEVRELLVNVAPFIQAASVAPRTTLRTLAELFQREEYAEELIANYESKVVAAREILDPILSGKKVAVIEVSPVAGMIWPLLSYSLSDDSYYEAGKIKSGGIASVVYRDLRLEPSSFVESVAETVGRDMYRVEMSEELVNMIDADYIIIATRAQAVGSEEVQAFVNSISIQATDAAKQNRLILIESSPWESDLEYQVWILKQIVESISGETLA